MKDYRDIWKRRSERHTLSDEQLMAYLEGRLAGPERRDIEELLSSEGMESDAIEGLQALSAAEAHRMRARLLARLWKRVGRRHRIRRKRGMNQAGIIAVAVLLVLLIACFLVFWMLRK